jgi:hypothetical protein
MALNQEQESIAQAIANSGNPHSAGIYSSNYRTAAQKYNIQKTSELDTRIQNLRTEINTSISNTWANIVNQKNTELNQTASNLRSDISKLNTDFSLKYNTLDGKITNECIAIRNRVEELSGDVKFARYELKSVGDKFTTLNHYVTNKNKEIILIIESLQKEIQLLKTPSSKKLYILPFVAIFLLMFVIGLVRMFNNSNTLMISY